MQCDTNMLHSVINMADVTGIISYVIASTVNGAATRVVKIKILQNQSKPHVS